MRKLLISLSILMCTVFALPASAQISIGIGMPNLSIGINLSSYPEMVAVPGYPVYYAPRLDSNYFFYDGMYWVYQDDNWYASSWYNGPWGMVSRFDVPLFVLRIPVRYYRQAPVYFSGWQPNAAPRWGDHWGNDWNQRRNGWDRWNRNAVPARPPLPTYQRNYSGDRYPRVEQQQSLQSRNYRYQPKEQVVRQHYEAQRSQAQPAPDGRTPAAQPRPQPERQDRNGGPADRQRPAPATPQAPTGASNQRGQAVQSGNPGQREAAPARPGNAPVAQPSPPVRNEGRVAPDRAKPAERPPVEQKSSPRPEPRPEPRQAPRQEPKPAPRQEPPRQAPKQEPVPEQRQEPRPEQKQEPRQEQRQEPRQRQEPGKGRDRPD